MVGNEAAEGGYGMVCEEDETILISLKDKTRHKSGF
jgi:hypothetical protein